MSSMMPLGPDPVDAVSYGPYHAFYLASSLAMPDDVEPEDYQGFAAWGVRHYGETWGTLQSDMMAQRNIYLSSDPVYKNRQASIRMWERTMDGRSFGTTFEDALASADWKLARSRLLGELLAASGVPLPGDTLQIRRDYVAGKDVGKEPSPGADETPLPDSESPWDDLRRLQEAKGWDLETYYLRRSMLKAMLIAERRNKCEDWVGAAKLADERLAVDRLKAEMDQLPEYLQSSVYYWRKNRAYQRRLRWMELATGGMELARVDEAVAAMQAQHDALQRHEEQLLACEPTSTTELTEKLLFWQKYNLTPDEHDCLVRLYGFTPEQAYAGTDTHIGTYRKLRSDKQRSRGKLSTFELRSLVTWGREGLVLNDREIAALVGLYGFPEEPRQLQPADCEHDEDDDYWEPTYYDAARDNRYIGHGQHYSRGFDRLRDDGWSSTGYTDYPRAVRYEAEASGAGQTTEKTETEKTENEKTDETEKTEKEDGSSPHVDGKPQAWFGGLPGLQSWRK